MRCKFFLLLSSSLFFYFSADVRNLISMSLVSNEKEALIYFKETLDMIEKRAKVKITFVFDFSILGKPS